jgi:hypothetical protein
MHLALVLQHPIHLTQLYWGVNQTEGTLVGFDPLNNALLAVWGFLRTGFGIVPTATHGLIVVNTPAAAMEGAKWNMYVPCSVPLLVPSNVGLWFPPQLSGERCVTVCRQSTVTNMILQEARVLWLAGRSWGRQCASRSSSEPRCFAMAQRHQWQLPSGDWPTVTSTLHTVHRTECLPPWWGLLLQPLALGSLSLTSFRLPVGRR